MFYVYWNIRHIVNEPKQILLRRLVFGNQTKVDRSIWSQRLGTKQSKQEKGKSGSLLSLHIPINFLLMSLSLSSLSSSLIFLSLFASLFCFSGGKVVGYVYVYVFLVNFDAISLDFLNGWLKNYFMWESVDAIFFCPAN